MRPILNIKRSWRVRYLYAIFKIVCLTSNGFAQNLERIGDEKPLTITGGINATGIGYAIDGLAARRDPFNWFLTGNINLSIYGWSVPLSFSYSNQNVAFRQPFNQYGISPEYKWIKGYLGYHNLTYSSYTLAGHVFLGGAIELTPGKFHFHSMYGRLNKSVEEDTITNTLPAFKRMGFAMKAGYGDAQNAIDLVLFRAADEINSLLVFPEKSGILPMENLVLSLIGKKKLTQRISLFAEAATSAITRDTRAQPAESSNVFAYTGFLYKQRETSEYYNAFKSSIAYSGNLYALQLNYERVDPGYQTLGAYFFNNDLENITVGVSGKMLNSKLDLSGNFGTQRNNLDDTEVSAVKRVVASINANFTPDEKWNLNGSYSNFTTFTNVRPRFDPFFRNDLDTLNFYQITQSATGAISHNFGNKQIKQSININGSFQIANETAQYDTLPDNTSRFSSGVLSYRYAFIPGNWSASFAVNVNRSELAGSESFTFGPNLILSKSLLQKKLRCSFSSSFNQVRNKSVVTGKVINLRLSGNYAVNKKHTFSLNLVTLRKFASAEDQKSFTEFTSTLNYGYSF